MAKLPRKKRDEDKNKPIWKTVERILKGKKSPQKAIVLGGFLMLAGGLMRGAGNS